MLVDVETFFLDALVATQAMCILDCAEQDEPCNECEHGYHTCPKSLYPYAAFHSVSLRVAEHSGQDGSKEASYAMY